MNRTISMIVLCRFLLPAVAPGQQMFHDPERLTAKTFLIMPILLPLSDLVGITQQVAMTAYCFENEFSNLAYPTNPVLLIVLELTTISYKQ